MSEPSFSNILIFTDGACSGNPGPGGWGAIVVTPESGSSEVGGNYHVAEYGGKDSGTTNNRMEMIAALQALRAISADLRPVSFYTDSTYVIRGITQWVWGWKKRGWKNTEGQPVQNRDLWEKLHSLVLERGTEGKVDWLYSRGHVGIPGNERCDEMAVNFSKGRWVDLYEGPLLNYSVAIFDLPEETDLPEMKPKKEKQKAYSYLSFVHGEVWRHQDWPSCERRVKGQSGAKFKKALSAANEKEILKSWGLPEDTTPFE